MYEMIVFIFPSPLFSNVDFHSDFLSCPYVALFFAPLLSTPNSCLLSSLSPLSCALCLSLVARIQTTAVIFLSRMPKKRKAREGEENGVASASIVKVIKCYKHLYDNYARTNECNDDALVEKFKAMQGPRWCGSIIPDNIMTKEQIVEDVCKTSHLQPPGPAFLLFCCPPLLRDPDLYYMDREKHSEREYFDYGRVFIFHRFFIYDAKMYAFRGDLAGDGDESSEIMTVKWTPYYFDTVWVRAPTKQFLDNELTKKRSKSNIIGWFGEDQEEFNCCRIAQFVPAKYVSIFMEDEGLTAKEAYQKLSRAIFENGDQDKLKELWLWLRSIMVTYSNGVFERRTREWRDKHTSSEEDEDNNGKDLSSKEQAKGSRLIITHPMVEYFGYEAIRKHQRNMVKKDIGS